MEAMIPRLFLAMLIGVIGVLIGLGLYLCRLERIPGLKLSHVLGLLLLSRMTDVGSFWWASQASGGVIAQAEINPVYNLLVSFLSPEAALFVGLFPTTVGMVPVLFLHYHLLLRTGAKVPEAKRLMFAAAAAISILSLVGASTNVSFALLGWNSPFLIG